jgi:hypothetical protein
MTTEQMDAVDAMKTGDATAPAVVVEEVTPSARPAAKRPKPQDRKPKKAPKKKTKVKVVVVRPAVVEKDEGTGEETTVSPAEYGRQVTLHGVTVTVPDRALGDFQTTDDLSVIGEAQEAGEHVDDELLTHALSRISPLLRRLVGFSGSREVLSALRRENDGELNFGHAGTYITELIEALSPNS